MDLTQIPKCLHFLGTYLALGVTLMSPPLQNTVVTLSHSIALPGGKGQKEWVPVRGRRPLPQAWGTISPCEGVCQQGAGLPCLIPHLLSAFVQWWGLSTRERHEYTQKTCLLFVSHSPPVQHGAKGNGWSWSWNELFPILKFLLISSDWHLSSRLLGFDKENPLFFFFLFLLNPPHFIVFISFSSHQNI